MHLFYWFMLCFSVLYGVEVDSKVPFQEILSNSFVYIDHDKNATIEHIDKKEFKPIKTKELEYGYSPDFVVWIKVVLTNRSNEEIKKIVEYGNPLTSYVDFFDAQSKKCLKSSGMLNKNPNEFINPTLEVTLKPFESRTLYIKLSSEVTALVAKLNVWNPKEYHKEVLHNGVVLALFFGAMGIIILYNGVIWVIIRKKMYVYYFVAFSGIFSYYSIYKGVAPLLLPKEFICFLNNIIPFIVLFPVIFLSLFAKEILELKSKPKLDKFFNTLLTVVVLSTIIFYFLEQHFLRNLFFVILFLVLGIITLSIKNNNYAKYLSMSLIVFFATALLMLFENANMFNIHSIVPYYSEIALLFETIAFSLILANSIKETEKQMEYKERMIDELDHRISGSLQSFMFEIEREEEKRAFSLEFLKQKLFATAELYRYLNHTQSFPNVDMKEYFTLIVESLQTVYSRPEITIEIKTDVVLKPKIAKTCGKILNEAITNVYKYAFSHNRGEVTVSLEKGTLHRLTIKDNGKGIEKKREGGLGLSLIRAFAKKELEDRMHIDSSNGTKIVIEW